MSDPACLYRGEVTHARLRPRTHRFRYSVFWLMIDIDRMRDAAAVRLFSLGRFNLLSLRPADLGDGSQVPLRAQIERRLAEAGVAGADGAIHLLTMPRVLGYAFNPISLYYCHGRDARLAAMIYEVTSTFGERRAYVLPVGPGDPEVGRFRHGCGKTLHVSPFLPMELTYDFRGQSPADRMALTINASDAQGLLIATAMTGQRSPLTDHEILRTALALPFSTLKVTLGIHWEALRLWLKGVPPVPGPARG